MRKPDNLNLDNTDGNRLNANTYTDQGRDKKTTGLPRATGSGRRWMEERSRCWVDVRSSGDGLQRGAPMRTVGESCRSDRRGRWRGERSRSFYPIRIRREASVRNDGRASDF